jgi:O-antigen ligase
MTASFDSARRILAVLIGLAIPISTALTNILCPLILLLILAEGEYKKKFNTLRQHPIVILAMLLFIIMLIGFFHTPVSFLEAGLLLDKYREFIYILLFILVFRDSQSRQWGLDAFIGAMTITLFLSYLMAITGWYIGKGTPEMPFVFKTYITQSLLMALAAYFLAVQYWKGKQSWKWLFGLWILLAIYNIIFMSEGRTGYLVLFCLIFLFFYQLYHLRGVLIGSIVLIVLSILAYHFSDVLRQRVDNVSESVQSYQEGQVHNSAELRLDFLNKSLTLVAQKPVFGHGTGSFSSKYKELEEKQGMNNTTNPHNEYLMIAVQWGLIGVGVFIALLYMMWKKSYDLKTQSALMAQGLVVTIAVGCLVNSLWLDNTEGHIFAYLIGVFYGGLKINDER